MAHKKRNGKFLWRSKRANHGRMGCAGREKSGFCRAFRRKHKKSVTVS